MTTTAKNKAENGTYVWFDENENVLDLAQTRELRLNTNTREPEEPVKQSWHLLAIFQSCLTCLAEKSRDVLKRFLTVARQSSERVEGNTRSVMGKSCGLCEYLEINPNFPDSGECRYNAPVVLPDGSTRWPRVHTKDWCAKFSMHVAALSNMGV
eukprot:g37493.t1